MITIQDWDRMVTENKNVYFARGSEVYKVPRNTALAYDPTLENYCLCMATRNTTFNEVFKTKADCARFIIDNIKQRYCEETNG